MPYLVGLLWTSPRGPERRGWGEGGSSSLCPPGGHQASRGGGWHLGHPTLRHSVPTSLPLEKEQPPLPPRAQLPGELLCCCAQCAGRREASFTPRRPGHQLHPARAASSRPGKEQQCPDSGMLQPPPGLYLGHSRWGRPGTVLPPMQVPPSSSICPQAWYCGGAAAPRQRPAAICRQEMTLQVLGARGLPALGPGWAQAEAEPRFGLAQSWGLRVLVWGDSPPPPLPSCYKGAVAVLLHADERRLHFHCPAPTPPAARPPGGSGRAPQTPALPAQEARADTHLAGSHDLCTDESFMFSEPCSDALRHSAEPGPAALLQEATRPTSTRPVSPAAGVKGCPGHLRPVAQRPRAPAARVCTALASSALEQRLARQTGLPPVGRAAVRLALPLARAAGRGSSRPSRSSLLRAPGTAQLPCTAAGTTPPAWPKTRWPQGCSAAHGSCPSQPRSLPFPRAPPAARHSPVPFVIWVFTLLVGQEAYLPTTASPAPPVLKYDFDGTAQVLSAPNPDSAGHRLSLLEPFLPGPRQGGHRAALASQDTSNREVWEQEAAPLAPGLQPPHLGQLFPSDHRKPMPAPLPSACWVTPRVLKGLWW